MQERLGAGDRSHILLRRIESRCPKIIYLDVPYFMVGRKLSIEEQRRHGGSPCNFLLDNPKISRIHLTIIKETDPMGANQFFVLDGTFFRRSTHGIFNEKGDRVVYRKLEYNDLIRFGGYEINFVQDREYIINRSTL